jgi:hypothetical protein
MRKLKFRAWDKSGKIWWRWLADGECGYLLFNEDESRWMTLGEALIDDNFVVVQFTCLLDKNGNEIYEGDICKVVDERGPWNVAAQEMHSLDAFHFWNHVSENIESGVSYEIIGNICENPQLLSL